jgi:hypothetical protein
LVLQPATSLLQAVTGIPGRSGSLINTLRVAASFHWTSGERRECTRATAISLCELALGSPVGRPPLADGLNSVEVAWHNSQAEIVRLHGELEQLSTTVERVCGSVLSAAPGELTLSTELD